MRAVFGLLLVMLGLATAVVWIPDHDSERQLAIVTDIATQGMPRRAEPSDRSGRTFSPNTPLIATVELPAETQPRHIVGVARVVPTASVNETGPANAAAPLQPSPAKASPQPMTGPAIVVTAPALPMPVRTADPATAARTTPMSEAARHELARSIQRELKRVGCYAGDVDGTWGVGSRRAMAAFTDRVNASLPIEQPDFILLTLVQGHQAGICGKGCPAGQVAGEHGRCMPGAVVAQARRGQDRSSDVVQFTSSQTATAPASRDSGWTTQVTRAPNGPQGAPSTGSPGVIVGAAAGPAPAPLPGRMAIGGPQQLYAPAYGAPPASLASAAIQAELPPFVDAAGRPFQWSEKRDRPRRTARGGGGFRVSAVGFRAPRFVGPVYFAAAPRRGRTWTGSFFGFP